MSDKVEDGMLLAYKRLRLAYDVRGVENQRLRETNDQFRRVIADSERALADAEQIIEGRTGKGSWVGSLILARVRATLNDNTEIAT